MLRLVLEIINSVIQWQWQGNAGLIVAVLRRLEIWKKVSDEVAKGEAVSELLSVGTALHAKLLPVIEAECLAAEVTDASEAEEIVRKHSLVGIIPPPPVVSSRNFLPSSASSAWLRSYVWGLVFTRCQSLPLFDWRKINMLRIEEKAT